MIVSQYWKDNIISDLFPHPLTKRFKSRVNVFNKTDYIIVVYILNEIDIVYGSYFCTQKEVVSPTISNQTHYPIWTLFLIWIFQQF